MKIFVSYRRNDSALHATLIHDAIGEYFGEDNVFFDVEEIPYGADFANVIDERIGQCDVLVAVIGPKWAIDDSGRRRLFEENDFVRHEVGSALNRNIRVIPVLVGGATLPAESDLPPTLRRLCRLNMPRFDDAHIQQNLEDLLASIEGRDRFSEVIRTLREHASLRRRAMLIALGAAFAAIVFGWMKAFDVLQLDTQIESWTMAAGDALSPPPLADKLAIVTIGDDTIAHYGKKFDESWRREHAQLVRSLVRSGASAVAFDLYLDKPSEFDRTLLDAIDEARANGVSIVFGTSDGLPSPVLGDKARVGALCIGTRIGYANTAPIAIEKADRRLASFSLLAAYPGSNIGSVIEDRVFLKDAPREIVGYSFAETIGETQRCGAIAQGDNVAQLILRLSPLDELRSASRRHRYQDVVFAPAPEKFNGRIVLVGLESAEETFAVFSGFRREQRFGVELHADAVNALLREVRIHPLHPAGQGTIMLLMAAIGAALRLIDRRLVRRLALFSAVALYFAATVFMYLEFEILLNTLYHAFALGLACWGVAKIQAKRRKDSWHAAELRPS
jgi:CHASE2 domain-containing sensor protein